MVICIIIHVRFAVRVRTVRGGEIFVKVVCNGRGTGITGITSSNSGASSGLEFKLSFVVASLECGTVRVQCLEVRVVLFGVRGREAAVLAHVHLVASLLVRKVIVQTVHLARVRLERAALGERFVALVALVRAHTWRMERQR